MAENDELTVKIKENKDKYGTFVQNLYDNDEAAWKEIYEKVVLVGLRYHTSNGHCLGNIAKNRCLSEYDIFSDLYIMMTEKKRLQLYEYRGDLFCWMRSYIKEIVLKNCDSKTVIKESFERMSENDSNESLMYEVIEEDSPEMEVLEYTFDKLFKNNNTLENESNAPLSSKILKLNSTEIETLINESLKNTFDVLFKTNVDHLTPYAYDLLENAFMELFKTNPLGANILFFHGRLGLTSKAICNEFELPPDTSHINYVDNAFRQASKEIKRIIKNKIKENIEEIIKKIKGKI